MLRRKARSEVEQSLKPVVFPAVYPHQRLAYSNRCHTVRRPTLETQPAGFNSTDHWSIGFSFNKHKAQACPCAGSVGAAGNKTEIPPQWNVQCSGGEWRISENSQTVTRTIRR